MLSSTNFVPSGISSLNTMSSGAVPVFSMSILYVISSPSLTTLPVSGTLVFLNAMSVLFIMVVVSFVGLSSTNAVFLICLVYIPYGNSFTFTLKLNVVCPSIPFSFSGTYTIIPSSKFSAVFVE